MSAAEAIDDFAPHVRFAGDRDRNPILSSWLRSYADDKPTFTEHVERATYFDEHEMLIKSILARPETVTLIACNPEDDRHIYSWLCVELRPLAFVLHYGFTFHFARGNGCFRALLDRVLAERGTRELVFTHRSRKAKVVGPALGATYNPYRIFQ